MERHKTKERHQLQYWQQMDFYALFLAKTQDEQANYYLEYKACNDLSDAGQ